MTTVLVSDVEDGVRTVTLNRPDAMNTLTAGMVADLHAVLADVESDRDTRTVVLTGSGRAFCAGLDLNGYGGGDDTSIGVFRQQRDIAGLAERLHYLRQPVIAAVNGAAAGGGLALVLASDIRIAVPRAIFAVSFIRAGYSACDIGTSWLLPRLVGAARAHELMLTGRRFNAEEALRIGLLVDVTTDLDVAARAKAKEIALNPPFAVEMTKQGMWIALETPGFSASVEFENRQQVITAFTEDRVEAQAAFLGKRAPHYRGR